MSHTNLKGNPFRDPKTGNSYNRLLIKPTPKDGAVTESGVILPAEVLNICETGIVESVCEGSSIKVGDEVLYAKVSRENKEQYDSMIIGSQNLDSVYENEIWSVNEKPFNRLFVSPLSETTISPSGVVLPENIKGLPQRGVIHMAPEGSYFKTGDIIEYRKQEQAIYPTVNLDGAVYDVLWETDIFTANGAVSPYRIIIKIDIREQGKKRAGTQEGVALSPLFQFMMYNLQYGEVVQMGGEAKKHYPELEVGDIAIIHHTIESQPHRILNYELSKYRIIQYELRMIDSFNPNGRDIFGKINKGKAHVSKTKGLEISDTIIPFSKNVFLKFHFDLYEGNDEKARMSSLLYDANFDLTKHHDLDSLRNTIAKKQKSGAELYQTKFRAHLMQLQQLDPDKIENREHIEMLESGIESLKRDAQKVSYYINKNHLLQCKIAFPLQVNRDVIVTFKELYPISLFDKKYLIANEAFILAYVLKQTDNMPTTIIPKGERVLILPIEEEKESAVIIPDGAKEAPCKGRVIAVGEKCDDIEPEDVVLYKRHIGIEIDMNGVKHLIMEQNNILCIVEEYTSAQ
jgi:co-chaperonin GroES (HSP10)